jgi:outer membrane protein OmpA-like peptidoglycan-associated protein
MAFDLNKNDGSKDSSGKAPSKFDLSKGEAAGAPLTPAASKSKAGLIGLVGILLVGGGIWYYSSRPAADKVPTEVAVADSSGRSAVKAADTTAAVVSTVKPVAESTVAAPAAAVAALNNKVPATFGQGSSSFTKIDQLLIKRIVSYLAQNPGASINVNGYASSDGSVAINQTVSQARADAFKQYLVSKNVAEDRIVATGKGIENPIASNNNNAGRKKNRRVEITLP